MYYCEKDIMKKMSKGFTLIELMITVAIIGILAAIAMPNYTQYVIRSNRAAAQAEMMAIANKEEQILLANRAYVDETAIGYTLPTGVSNKYTYAIAAPAGTVPYYKITFTPSGTQASDGNLTLDSTGAKTPTSKW